MTNSTSSPSKVELNGHTALNSQKQNEITAALLQNGGFRRIQATLQQRLDAAGWTQDLKEYTTQLLRSGTAKTYDDVLEIVMKNINSEQDVENPGGIAAPNLRVPNEAKIDGSEAVKKELRLVGVAKK